MPNQMSATHKNGLKVAVVGATGAVGRELLPILTKRGFPVRELVPLASPRSEGKEISFNGSVYKCRALKPGCFEGVDVAFFDASDEISKQWALSAAEAGAWVVDNSATYRMESDIPLIVPEVNGDLLAPLLAARDRLTPRQRIIAGPNCTTVQLVVALKPIRDHWGLKRIVVSTYQSVSGAGTAAMEELSNQTAARLGGKTQAPQVFAHPIAFNCIPHIGGFKEEGYTSEELKVVHESRKILSLPNLRVSATAVRVPTFTTHGESVNIECERPFEISQVRAALEKQSGLVLQDDPKQNLYPMAVHAGGQDPVYVGRLRRDTSVENGLNLWVVSDNLRKGAALNAVQIGEILYR